MSNSINESFGPVNYGREILIPLKNIETACDEMSGTVEDPSICHSNITTIKTNLLRLIRVIDKAMHFGGYDSESHHSVTNNNTLDVLRSIYENYITIEMESQLSDLQNNEDNIESYVRIEGQSEGLNNWLTIVEFVSNRLDNIILSKLKKAYSIIETIELTQKEQIMSEITSCMEAIVTTCENYRTVKLHLTSLDTNLLTPNHISNIRKVCEALSFKETKSQNNKSI